MSKEYLEAFKNLKQELYYSPNQIPDVDKWHEIIDNALLRLESIDNAEPSEAMKMLESIGTINLGDNPYVAFESDMLKNVYKHEFATIKQALLKQQEPKKYLKWEDLEFKEETQEMKVLLNGKIYVLEYKFYTYEHNVIYLSTLDYDKVLTCMGDYSFDIQFFNDLHLERVE